MAQTVKNLPAKQETQVLSLGGEDGSPFQCSCLENPMDREFGGLQSIGCKTLDTAEVT